MKTLLAVLAMAALGGCAVAPPGPYYSSARVVDPYQWHTVSSVPANQVAGATTTYTTEEVVQPQSRVIYTTEPLYATQPVYVTQPVYQPYYYPPVSIGLDFVVGGWCCRGGWGGRGFGGRGYHRR